MGETGKPGRRCLRPVPCPDYDVEGMESWLSDMSARGLFLTEDGFFAGLGVRAERVMTDNGPGYRAGEFNALLESEGIRHVYTRPYSPWQNGKVERMNRTLAQEWQYGRAWDSEAGRVAALPAFIERYNWDRPHSACGGLPPMSRIPDVNNLLARNI